MKRNKMLMGLLFGFSGALCAMEADWESQLDKIKADKLDEALLDSVEKNEPPYIVAYLRNRGGNINIQNFRGDTPLHIAARNGNALLVQWLLLNDGALIGNRDQQMAYHKTTPEIKDIFKKTLANKALLACAQSGDCGGMEQAFMRGANPETHDVQGLTPFHLAAAQGHIDAVDCLYQMYPQYIATRDNEGRDALYWAIRNGHFDVVEWFVDTFPWLIEKQDMKYDRAVYWAAANGHMEVIDWLTDSYPHLAKSIDANSELIEDYAKRRGHSHIIMWLRERSSNNAYAGSQA